MKRTRSTNQHKRKVKYNVQAEPIVLSKSLIDLFLAEDSPADLIALYTFYYYTAKWQSTNQARATKEYVKKGLGWGNIRFNKTKIKLTELGLIKNVTKKNKRGKIIGWYIHIRFIWGINTPLPHRSDFPPSGFPHPVDNHRGNALRDINGNALRDINGNAEGKTVFDTFLELFPEKYNSSQKFKRKLQEFVLYREDEIKRPLGKRAQIIIKNKAIKYPIKICCEAFDHSMENGWTGFFPESIRINGHSKPKSTVGYKDPHYQYREADKIV